MFGEQFVLIAEIIQDCDLYTPAERLFSSPENSEIVTKWLQKYVRDGVGWNVCNVHKKHLLPPRKEPLWKSLTIVSCPG